MTLKKQASLVPILLIAFGSAPVAAQNASTTANGDDMEEIIVRGMFEQPDRVSGSAHRVDEATLEVFRYNDINRVLNLVPGVYSREEDGVGLRPNIGLRGGSSDRSQKVALMEDGVLISPAPYSAPAAYFFPLSARMVGVEVFKGPASIKYGPQTIGGAINLVSAPIPDGNSLMAELGGGSHGYRHVRTRAGTRTDKLGVMAELMHVGSDGFKQVDGGGDAGYEKNEIVLKSSHNFGPGVLQLRVGYADEISDETYLGLTEEDLREDPYRRYRASELDRMEWDWLAARANWEQPLFGGTLGVTGYVQEFDRAWRKFNSFNAANIGEVLANPDSPFNQLFVSILNGRNTDGISGSPDDLRIGTNDRSFLSSGVQGSLWWKFGSEATHVLEVGARFHTDRIDRLHDEFGFEQIGGEVVMNNQPRAIVADNTGYTQALALWVRDEIDFGRWTIVPGLRVEAIANSFTNHLILRKRENDYLVALPGIGATFKASDNLILLAGAHRGFSPAIPSLNEDLDPEESVNFELGGRWKGEFGRLELIGFYNDYSNLTAVCTVSSGCSPDNLDTQTNAGEVRTTGAEFGWKHELQLGQSIAVPIAVTYTFTEAEFRESFASINPQFGIVEPGFELPYVPPHRANVNIGFAGAQWGVELSLTHIAGMRDRAGSGAFAADEGSDESTVVDLAAHFEISGHWTLSGRVDNLADDVYVVSRRPFGARPGKPRSFQAMLTYRIDH